MKALVPSAGLGTRLRPFSHSMPKQLIPVANTPVLERALHNIRELGITEIGLVVGNRAAEIEAAIGDGSRFRARVTYVRQDVDDDFVMYLGDIILADGIADAAAEFLARRPAAQVVVHKVADPQAFGVVSLGVDGEVQELEEKPARPRSDLALCGVYFFTPAVHEAVAAIVPGPRGELDITDALQWLVSHGADVRAHQYTGYWKDTGQVDDVLECNRELLTRLSRSVSGHVDQASELLGTVVVEPGARIVRSRITGPVIVGAGSVVEDSHLGPYTSVGRDCTVTESRLEDSIALDGACITAVGRLRHSLIGRSARVGASRDNGEHVRLVVGDHTRVEMTV